MSVGVEFPDVNTALESPTSLSVSQAYDILSQVAPYDDRGEYGELWYDTIVGASNGPDGKVSWLPDDQHRAQSSLGAFLYRFQELVRDPVGLDPTLEIPEFSKDDLQTPSGAVDFIRSWQAAANKSVELGYLHTRLPILEYQGKDNANLQVDTRGDFLHFGETTDKRDANIAQDIRIYANALPKELASLAAYIIGAAADSGIGLIYGKFPEYSRSEYYRRRNDGLILYGQNIFQLKTVLTTLAIAHTLRPDKFEAEPVLLGQKVTIDGVEQPTVRLAQSPEDKTMSFNRHRLHLIQRGLALLNSEIRARIAPEADAERFAVIMQPLAEDAGVHPHNFNFNVSQDLGVISNTIDGSSDIVNGVKEMRDKDKRQGSQS